MAERVFEWKNGVCESAGRGFELKNRVLETLDKCCGSAKGLFFADLEDDAFAGGFNLELGFVFGGQFTGVVEEGVHLLVVAVGVVMEEAEFLDAGFDGEGNGIVHTAVSPADVGVVTGGIVLGIEDEDVGLADEFDHLKVFPTGAGFGVGKKADDAVGRK